MLLLAVCMVLSLSGRSLGLRVFDNPEMVYPSRVVGLIVWGLLVLSFLRFLESRLERNFLLIFSFENLIGMSSLNSFLLYFCLLNPFLSILFLSKVFFSVVLICFLGVIDPDFGYFFFYSLFDVIFRFFTYS